MSGNNFPIPYYHLPFQSTARQKAHHPSISLSLPRKEIPPPSHPWPVPRLSLLASIPWPPFLHLACQLLQNPPPITSPRTMATPMLLPLSLHRCNPPHPSCPRRTLRTTAAIAGIPANPVRLKQPPFGLAKKGAEPMVVGGLEVLYDDGYGTESVKDYLNAAREIIKPDGGPPRWFCPVECGPPVAGSPVLLFLPGIDGVGMGLILHHKSLGRPDNGLYLVILSGSAIWAIAKPATGYEPLASTLSTR